MTHETINTVPQDVVRPTDVCHIFPDPDATLDVVLVIENTKLPAEKRTWSIVWCIEEGQPEYRVIQVVREGPHATWFKWGVRTTAYQSCVQKAAVINVGKFSLVQRKLWEDISDNVSVRPDCNGSLVFVEELLRKAASAGLLSGERVAFLVSKIKDEL